MRKIREKKRSEKRTFKRAVSRIVHWLCLSRMNSPMGSRDAMTRWIGYRGDARNIKEKEKERRRDADGGNLEEAERSLTPENTLTHCVPLHLWAVSKRTERAPLSSSLGEPARTSFSVHRDLFDVTHDESELMMISETGHECSQVPRI